MANPKDFLLSVLSDVEDTLDQAKFMVKKKVGALGPFVIQTYYGYGNHEVLYIKGRLLEDEGLDRPEEDDPAWKNLVTMLHRYESDEIPHARLRATFQEQTQEISTDGEGYFQVEFTTNKQLPDDLIWREVQFELIDQIVEDQGAVKATGEVMVPGDAAHFGVISDVDDTILISKSTDLWQKGKLTFLQNA
ncbi:MAG: hypothetical protein WBA23_14035, partial [Tunicatimonas sp.]